jgi:hypothetical protein
MRIPQHLEVEEEEAEMGENRKDQREVISRSERSRKDFERRC